MRSISFAAERAPRDERGATIVEFLGVMLLAVVALMVLLQMAFWLWARNVAVNAADEGARAASEIGRDLADGEARTRSVLHDGLGGSAQRFSVRAMQDGDTVVVEAVGLAPRIVPFLAEFSVVARARAFDEDGVLQP